jgi:hypothetical protein
MGLRVLRARGSELDRAFAFGVVRQLLERPVAEEPALLAGVGEGAAAGLARVDPSEEAREAGLFPALHALYWLVVDLAARRPLAIVVDDAHWADAASLRWLVFLGERIEELPVVLIAATRPAEPGADQELLDALSATARVVGLAPLTAAASASVVRTALGAAGEDAFVDACHRATGGNPFLLEALVREVAADGARRAAAEANRALSFGPEGVARAVRRRLRALGPEATALARAVAVLGAPARVSDAAALAGAQEPAARAAADALAAVEVLAADRALEFVHPIVAAAVYEQIPPLERERLHSAAAELLVARGAGDEAVASHLLRVAPSGDAGRVRALRAAARAAAARGAAGARAISRERWMSRRRPPRARACCATSGWPRPPIASATPSRRTCVRRWMRPSTRLRADGSRWIWGERSLRPGSSGRRSRCSRPR